jgi:hypothetical protein
MAANKMFAEVVIAGSYRNLSKATKGAEKEMKGFGSSVKKISAGVKAAWAGGIAIGLDMLWGQLVKVGKAASEEAASVAVLRNAMNNSWKATDKMAASQEVFITKMQNMTAIADDKLRPAFAKIVRVTKSSTAAQRAFGRVLNISAGTGKDVNVVAQAYSKYLGGNKTALDKLIPGLKNAGDKLAFIDKTYANAAQTVGDTKPFERINLMFQDIQERLGAYILPYVKQFADWLAGPEAQTMIDKMFLGVKGMFDYLQSADGKRMIQGWADGLIGLGDALADVAKWLGETKWFWDFIATNAANNPFAITGRLLAGGPAFINPNTPSQSNRNQALQNAQVTQYVTINGVVSGNDVVKALKNAATAKGQTVLKLIQ